MKYFDKSQTAYEEANKSENVLRRPRFFPLKLNDIGDINNPSENHYIIKEFKMTPSVHWTFLVEVVSYEHCNFHSRPEILCKDIDGHEFNAIGYFEEDMFGRRNYWWDTEVSRTIKPSNVLAIRYAESKLFMDTTRGIRIEDRHVKMIRGFPITLDTLLKTADKLFQRKASSAHSCWCECGKIEEEGVKLLKCGRCKEALYFSKECQVSNWKSQHKKECKIILIIKELIGQGSPSFDIENFANNKWCDFVF
jgi:hypothetical protein